MDKLLLISLLSRYNIRKQINSYETAFSVQNHRNLTEQHLYEFLSSISDNKYYSKYLSADYLRSEGPVITLKNMPVLDKQTLISNEQQILHNPKNIKLEKILTSGSSGLKGFTYLSKDELMRNRAIQLMWWMWAGYVPGIKTIQLGVGKNRSIEKRLKDNFLNIDYHPAFGQSESEILSKISQYKDSHIGFLAGYASSLYLYALVAEKYQLNISFKGAISWGDKLFDHYSEKLNQVFGCQVNNTYGSSEGFYIAGQCPFGNLHVTTSHIYLEILDENLNEVKPGDIGNVYVSRLDAKHFPLIRYKIGDLAAIKPAEYECPCGRKSLIIDRIVGRDTDLIKYTGGYLTVQILVYILKQFNNIIQWQVHQKNIQSIDLLLIVSKSFTKYDEVQICVSIEKQTKEALKVSIIYVNEIRSTGVGKPQLIVSHL
jgi:phenylacetate-CoA ligase